VKNITENEYNKSINNVLEYINLHLQDSIDLKVLAFVANISEFHFHRIFKAFIGESLGSYITRLRLESAAKELQISKLNLSEIAEKTGYNSQYALSKAFKKHFGIAPSAFKNIESFFSAQVKSKEIEIINLEPEIRELEELKIVYIRIIAEYGAAMEYKTAWEDLLKFAIRKQILYKNTEFIGLSFDDPKITRKELCRFYACMSINKEIKPEGKFGTRNLESGKFAVFTLKGPYSGLSDLYNRIYYHWLPMNYFKLRNSMPFEKYLNHPDKVDESEILTEIFIPIK